MAGDAVGPGSDAEQLERIKAALGVRPTVRKAAAKKAPVKKAAKKAQPRKQVAKKAPAKKVAPKAAKKAPGRKAAAKKAAAADPEIPDEVAGEVVVAEPVEIVVALHELVDPARTAHDLWVQGTPWEEVALRSGYASAQSASAAVALWLQRGAIHDGVQAARSRAALALSVTERVKSAFWDQMLMGDKDAAQVVLAANRDFYRMAGLEAGALTVNSKRTIIISDSAEQGGMAAQLKAAALADEQARHAAGEEQVTDTDQDVR